MKDDRSHEISAGGGFNGSIFDHITSLENLFGAWREFKKNKSKKLDVTSFSLNLEDNIFNLRDELISGGWECGGYKKFSIKDPKPRTIHKATVRDRVLYQAIYRILYPLFDKTFIFDSYSSRNEKGTLASIRRLNIFLRKLSTNYTRTVYALKCDIKKFFDSVDQDILMGLLQNRIKNKDATWLLERIIKSFPEGLPLGNITSQLFANIYLNELDQFIKQTLKIKYYIRYCDDFVILNNNPEYLKSLIPRMGEFLENRLKLSLHPNKVTIRKYRQGIDFLGYVSFPRFTILRVKTKKRMFKRVKARLIGFQNGLVKKESLKATLLSYFGMLKHCNAFLVKQDLLKLVASFEHKYK